MADNPSSVPMRAYFSPRQQSVAALMGIAAERRAQPAWRRGQPQLSPRGPQGPVLHLSDRFDAVELLAERRGVSVLRSAPTIPVSTLYKGVQVCSERSWRTSPLA
jgi:hypothetical protein